MQLEGIELDRSNVPFLRAAEAVLNGRNAFVTGEAGTGKTTFLHVVVSALRKRERNVVVLAPTGVAAVNAKGQTLHSFFLLPFRPLLMSDDAFALKPRTEGGSTVYTSFRFNATKLEVIKAMEVLVIDEVSMVRSDLLQAVDRLLRVFRGQMNAPFGGVQVVLIGDAYQLPPVLKSNEEHILAAEFRTRFFFGAPAYEQGGFEPHILTKIYRQTDESFISLLNRIRQGQLTISDVSTLQVRQHLPDDAEGFIHLVTHRVRAESINEEKLQRLPGDLVPFEGWIDGKFPEWNFKVPNRLAFKVGAQVMAVQNDWRRGVHNGMMGRVLAFHDEGIEVKFDSNSSPMIMQPHKWLNIEYYLNDEKKVEERVIGTYTQIPLQLAWAITVHKSQGLTFEKVIADLSGSFSYGQEYVALSRCRSLANLHLSSSIQQQRLGPHPRVRRFYDGHFGAA